MPKVAVLPGDGIGPEVTTAAQRVLAVAIPGLHFHEAPIGAAALALGDEPLPAATLALCERSDAILFGAVGGPGFDHLPPERRPEAALLRLRKHFDLFANVRPVRVYPGLEHLSPLRPELARGADLVVVRELTGGVYFGEKSLTVENGTAIARETLTYSEREIERVVRFGFELAQTRRCRLTSVDKANVLISSQLWRRVVTRLAGEYPEVRVDHLLVDNAAMQLIKEPSRFDVIVTENMFGDILSDEAAMIAGSIGTAPSASLTFPDRDGNRFGLYEPIAGTAPDIAGLGIANPTAAILSAALLARFSLGNEIAARAIESAVATALTTGPRTRDLTVHDESSVTTEVFADAVLSHLPTSADLSFAP